MPSTQITKEGAKRIQASHEKYVEALRELNALRSAKPARGNEPDYPVLVAEARRSVDEALAEWIMLFQHETGRHLTLVR